MSNEAEAHHAGLDEFADWVDPVPPSLLCQDLYRRFSNEPDLLSVAVVDNWRPLGLIHRSDFMMRLAHSFGRALYAKKPVTTVMDADPLCVDRGEALERVQHEIATSRPSALIKGFIITHEGRYTALGTALSLIRHSLARAEHRASELGTALTAARCADAAKATFLATMSHELRTPLTAIIGFAELIEDQALGELDVNYIGYAHNIRSGGEHLLAIVGSILDYAKAEHGGVDLHEEVFDLADEMDFVRDTLAAHAARERIDLRLTAARRIMLKADARIVRQMALNLAGNALKFTPQGGRVEIRVGSDEGAAWFAVEDTGCGMDAAGLELALQPFRQVENGLSRRHEGTGLGLPLVKAFAEAHGARLSLASILGAGTTATITFPLARTATHQARAA